MQQRSYPAAVIRRSKHLVAAAYPGTARHPAHRRYPPHFQIPRLQTTASSWDETLEDSPLYQLYRIAFMLVVGWMPGYLFFNATGPTKYWGKSRSHFNPNSAIYADRERWMIVLSDIFLVVMLLVLAALVHTFSLYTMVKLYVVPYFIVNSYLVLITYLQLSFSSNSKTSCF
ncbi:hypothetical protein PR003_g29518 [Phytophthora rubi]|uniref:Uncharacterized protein n=1 Tax=Phytophthora rubi TaxID=129364 RepID=A0A6A4BK99_9STRA|nr:hypothetical protein PR001_g31072 [Phytophthora rubi]KAE8965407.1 hypothetical protein PR002_g28685 [Phytophthora rubi]KAE9274755.1 hypothetical protein PR003_g29518 [Phytophthora rubi]